MIFEQMSLDLKLLPFTSSKTVNQGQFCLPRDNEQCQETCLVATTGGGVAAGAYRVETRDAEALRKQCPG